MRRPKRATRVIEAPPELRIQPTAPLLNRQKPVIHLENEVGELRIFGDAVHYGVGLCVPRYERRIARSSMPFPVVMEAPHEAGMQVGIGRQLQQRGSEQESFPVVEILVVVSVPGEVEGPEGAVGLPKVVNAP